jgi:histidinol dehydrogenase
VPREISYKEHDFDVAVTDLVNARRGDPGDVRSVVEGIVNAVRDRGDDALFEITQRLDQHQLDSGTIRVNSENIAQARSTVAGDLVAALQMAADRIDAFHRNQLPKDLDYVDADGIGLGQRWRPIDAVGLYVPGGRAAYPSSLLMNAIPARVAGVKRRVMVTPTPAGEINPLLLVAAEIAGIDEIFQIGGAQAVAALAYGTQSVPRVDKIVGPGNAYVAEAKRQVYGQVGIDSIAGPSEVLIVADGKNDPNWIAIDLLSQAEHDDLAQAILITDDDAFAQQVKVCVEQWLETLPRREIAAKAWHNHGAIIVVADLQDAPALIDRLAPEHLQLAMDDAADYAKQINHAGAIFIGRHTPEAVGDYVAGPNHVLPTDRTARFSSGLGTLDFMKRTTWVSCDADGLARIGPAATKIARAEGLDAHGLSIWTRLRAGADSDRQG